MCNVCDIADEIGPEKTAAIVEAVQREEENHWSLIILSILYTLDTPNFKVSREAAQRAAKDLDAGIVSLGEDISDDWQSFTFSVKREEMKKAPTSEISDDNPVAQLFKALGLEF